MKNYLLLALAAVALCFTACKKDNPVTGISLDKTMVCLEIGDSDTLTATVAPDDATNKDVDWSVADDAIATVEDGVVKAVAIGETTVTVTTVDGGFTASATITVAESIIKVTGVTLDKPGLELEIGDSDTLTATVAPDNAKNKGVEWSVADDAIATVEDGVVTAVAAGETTVTVTTVDGGFKAAANVVVKAAPIKVTGVSLNKTMVALEIGESVTVEATVTPETAVNKEVKWSIADATIASVNNGEVKGLKEGETTLTATTADGGHTATIPVKVVTEKVAVENVGISYPPQINEGEEDFITVFVVPLDATNRNVTITLSDPEVLSVEYKGANKDIPQADDYTIKGLKPGTCKIKAVSEDGGFEYECTITVKEVVNVTEINIDPKNATIEIGQTEQLTAAVLPNDADNKEVEWSSSDTSVATVDANGLVTGVAEGEATITATAKDGSGVTGTAKVTVAIIPTSVTFNGKTGLSEENIFLTWHGKVVDLKAVTEPKEASLKTLFWNLNGATYDCSPVWDYDITDDKATISVVISKDEQHPQDVRTTISAKLSENSMPLAKAIIVSRCCFWGYRSFSEGNISNEFDILHFGPEFFHANEYFRWDATGDRQFKNGWYFVGFCPPIGESMTSSSELYYKDSYIPADEYTLTSSSKNIKITKMGNVCYKVERTDWTTYEDFTLTYTCGEYVYDIPGKLIP